MDCTYINLEGTVEWQLSGTTLTRVDLLGLDSDDVTEFGDEIMARRSFANLILIDVADNE